jgi:hypothetical protein
VCVFVCEVINAEAELNLVKYFTTLARSRSIHFSFPNSSFFLPHPPPPLTSFERFDKEESPTYKLELMHILPHDIHTHTLLCIHASKDLHMGEREVTIYVCVCVFTRV